MFWRLLDRIEAKTKSGIFLPKVIFVLGWAWTATPGAVGQTETASGRSNSSRYRPAAETALPGAVGHTEIAAALIFVLIDMIDFCNLYKYIYIYIFILASFQEQFQRLQCMQAPSGLSGRLFFWTHNFFLIIQILMLLTNKTTLNTNWKIT